MDVQLVLRVRIERLEGTVKLLKTLRTLSLALLRKPIRSHSNPPNEATLAGEVDDPID